MKIHDEYYCEVDKPFEGARRLVKINAGTDVDRFVPRMVGKLTRKLKVRFIF